MLKDKNFLCCLAVAVIGIGFSIAFFNQPVHDYGNYFFGSRFALRGENISDIYEPYRFNLMIRNEPEMHQEKFLDNYAVVPPFTLLFYIPFTLMEVHASKCLFNIFSVLVMSFFLFRLLKHLDVKTKWILLLPFLFLVPLRTNVLFGQTYLLLAGLLMGGYAAAEKQRNYLSGFYFALTIALKISPAILLVYLLRRKNYKALFSTLGFTLIFFLTALYFTGFRMMETYLLEYVPRMAVNEINNPYATTYQSFTVLLRNLFIPDQLLNPDALHSSFAFSLLSGMITGIIIFLLMSFLLKTRDHFYAFACILLAGCLLTAYTASYALIFLIPLAIELIRKEKFVLCLLVFLICSIPVNYFQSFPLLLRFPRLYLILILFMLGVGPQIHRKEIRWLIPSMGLFTGLALLMNRTKNDESIYLLEKETALLTYDFNLTGHELKYTVLDETGPSEKSTRLNIDVNSIQPLEVRNDQVFYQNKAITGGSGNKIKPVLVNGNTVLYLSDEHRGIGFYALRKITLSR